MSECRKIVHVVVFGWARAPGGFKMHIRRGAWQRLVGFVGGCGWTIVRHSKRKEGWASCPKRVRGKYLLKGRDGWGKREGAKGKGEGKEGVKGSMVLFSGSSSAF